LYIFFIILAGNWLALRLFTFGFSDLIDGGPDGYPSSMAFLLPLFVFNGMQPVKLISLSVPGVLGSFLTWGEDD
jgi:hypothetical protein